MRRSFRGILLKASAHKIENLYSSIPLRAKEKSFFEKESWQVWNSWRDCFCPMSFFICVNLKATVQDFSLTSRTTNHTAVFLLPTYSFLSSSRHPSACKVKTEKESVIVTFKASHLISNLISHPNTSSLLHFIHPSISSRLRPDPC